MGMTTATTTTAMMGMGWDGGDDVDDVDDDNGDGAWLASIHPPTPSGITQIHASNWDGACH